MNKVVRSIFRDIRMKEDVVCKKCSCKKHNWLSSKWQFQCAQCDFRTTLKSATVIENSRSPFRTWFLVMLFMTTTKKGISACELQRPIGHKRYMDIWSVMLRLRGVMGKRDDLYQLSDMIEFDEGYFEKQVSEHTKSNLKQCRGSERQINLG